MKNPFTALFRARDKPQDSVSAAPVFYFGTSLDYRSEMAAAIAEGETRGEA